MKDYGIGVGAVIVKEKHVLLVRHQKQTPWHGTWIIPGGGLEEGEGLEEGVKREIEEELSLIIKIRKPLEAHFSFHAMEQEDIQRYILLVSFLAKPIGDKLQIRGEEVAAARWVRITEVEDMDVHPDSRKPLQQAQREII